MSYKLEPAIWSRDTGQWMAWFGRCQLLITRCHISKKYTVNQGCMSLSTYYLEYGRHVARLHRRHRRRAYAPTRNTDGLDNMRKSVHGFPLAPYMGMRLRYNCILAEPRLPTVIRKVKFTDLVNRATSPKMQLARFRFYTNSKAHSFLWLAKYGNFSENSKLTREARRHPTLRPLFTY